MDASRARREAVSEAKMWARSGLARECRRGRRELLGDGIAVELVVGKVIGCAVEAAGRGPRTKGLGTRVMPIQIVSALHRDARGGSSRLWPGFRACTVVPRGVKLSSDCAIGGQVL